MKGEEKRRLARRLFEETLADLDPAQLVRSAVDISDGALRIMGTELAFSPSQFQRVTVMAFGKAALAMREGWVQVTAGWLPTRGMVCSPTGPGGGAERDGFIFFRGGHPEPNPESLSAADLMLRMASESAPDSLLVYLISGGGSALVERPLVSGLSLDELKHTYRALVLGGAPIGEINTIRKHLSAIKGGRLAAAARGTLQLSLIISDVPGDDLTVVSSGPTLPDASTVDDCYRIDAQRQFAFPPSVRRLFDQRHLTETPKFHNEAFARAHWHLLMDNARACEVLAEHARAAGLSPVIDHTVDEWDADRAALYLLSRIAELKQKHPNACLIAGGEVLVKVTNGGRGGRNQHFALLCAGHIAGSDLCVLSAGTDGIDGNSPAAGAIVDGTTAKRLLDGGIDGSKSLRDFNSYDALSRVGATVEPGPTGNNVRDLRLIL